MARKSKKTMKEGMPGFEPGIADEGGTPVDMRPDKRFPETRPTARKITDGSTKTNPMNSNDGSTDDYLLGEELDDLSPDDY